MFFLKKDLFVSFMICVVLLFSLGASAEDANYECSAAGGTGGNFNGVFTASSEGEAVAKAIQAFRKELIVGQVICKKQ